MEMEMEMEMEMDWIERLDWMKGGLFDERLVLE
jgi:hypothetical protein